MSKRALKTIITFCLAVSIIFTGIPFTTAVASAKSKLKHSCDNHAKDEPKAAKYLVLVGQSNGTYQAYNDIAFLPDKNLNNLMVKAKPIATALGLGYQNYAGRWNKKGCTLSLNGDKNVYSRNKKTFYFYDYDSSTKKTTTNKINAQYKQMVYKNYNAVHCASLSTLVNYQYYDTTWVNAYSSLGYSGVVVYNKYNYIYNLPDISYTNLNGNNNGGNNGGNNGNNQNYTTAKVVPTYITDSTYKDMGNIEATYYTAQSNTNQLLDLTDVLSAYYGYGLPYDGIYGYGNCDSAVTIQGYDQNGSYVGEIKTNGSEFLINFPKAVKLMIIGAQKNLFLDFTPVKPIVITDTAKLTFNQIGWLYSYDGFSRQYFVISEKLRFRLEGITSAYTLSRKMIDPTNREDVDNANSYQRIIVTLKSPYSELVSQSCSVTVQKMNQGAINNSLVLFANTGNAVLAPNYETKLITMITTLSNSGLKTYYPSTNWNRQLVMKLTDNTVNTSYSYINIDPSALNLDHYYDYYIHLHEMTHFYEATQLHYGFRFEAWSEGNAINLAKKTMDNLSVSYKDASGNDYIALMYKTDFSFLTQDNRKNFEAYYLNATGWNASVTGYYFTKFLQDTYGSDVVYRILDKVYAAKIPTGYGRNSTYDKQFTDCIKAATSPNVFQLFVEYCVE